MSSTADAGLKRNMLSREDREGREGLTAQAQIEIVGDEVTSLKFLPFL